MREAEAEAFAEGAALPIVAENCPACFDAPKERYRVKCLLATQEAAFPMLFQSLTKCLLPLMEPGVEDFLRRRREAYGRASGPVHVPPPLPKIGTDDAAAAAAAARLASATHGQYNAQAAWGASLAVSMHTFSGRGADKRASAGGEVGAATGWAEERHDEVDYHVAPRRSSGGALARRIAIPSLQAAIWSAAVRAASGAAEDIII